MFWDVNIPPGKTWADVIEQKLSASKAAIVLWSKTSTASKWVREEARLAHDQGKLLPVLIDGTVPPFGFGEIQSAGLQNWHGATDDSHWRSLLDALATCVGSGGAKPAQFQSPPPPAAKPAPIASSARRRLPMRRGAIVLASILGAIAIFVTGVIIFVDKEGASERTSTQPTFQPTATRSSTVDGNGYGSEAIDFGIEPINELRTDVSGATPTSIPGATVFYTDDIQNMLRRDLPLALIDVLEGDHDTIPGAVRMAGIGQGGNFKDEIQRDLKARLARITDGNKSRTVIFFCAGVHCWESYNAALRARALGYTNVVWYRGGLQAWREAGLPLRAPNRPWPPD